MIKPALALALVLIASFGVAFARAETAEARFLAESSAAMNKMMAGMEIKPSGDVDKDFVEMMVPHHRGASDMAIAELRAGRNKQLRRIAQEIVLKQDEEIAAMQHAVSAK